MSKKTVASAAIIVLILTVLSVYISFSLQSIQQDGFDAPAAPLLGASDNGKKEKARHLTLEELTANPWSISCSEPLRPMYDRIVDSTSINSSAVPPRNIPRTIHASMRSRCLSPDTYDAMQAWKDALPHHSFYFHDDDAVDRLFSMPFKEFPALTSLMRCVRFKGAMRIDVWRLLIIYRFGGLYTDVDMFPTEKFTETEPIKVDDDAFFLSDAWNRPSQWFFAMEPKHPIAYYTIFEIYLRLIKLDSIERPSVVFVTGPDAVKFGYGRASLAWTVKGGPDVFLPGTHQCKWNKTVTKLPRSGYVDQLNMKETVDWNETSTIKMTRKDKINRHHGMQHWLDEKNNKKIEFDGSCIDYLYSLDHGLVAASAGKYSPG